MVQKLSPSRIKAFTTTLLLLVAFGASLGQTRILFVGNSLTYSNDLPALVENLARSDGKNVSAKMIAFPNYSLEDHWNEPNIKKALTETRFDFVIFQQGPSAMPASRLNLIEYALKFGSLCR